MKKTRHFAATAAVLAAVALVGGCRGGEKGAGGAPGAAPAATTQPEAPTKPQKPVIEARGVYLTGWSAGGKKKMQNTVALLKKSGMNAVVIDVKDSDGAITFPMDIPWAKEVEAKRGKIKEIARFGYAERCKNIDWVMNLLKENNIYPIARIAVFSDDILPRVRPDMSVKTASGGMWENRKRETWLNPHSKEAWKYTVAVAAEAAKKGFKEIQWDYVRFPTDGRLLSMRFPGATQEPQSKVIANFLAYARKELEPYGVNISADIFGLTGLVSNDMGIGQVIHSIAENVDYISPMVYPSHFAKGEYGIRNPDSEPYKIVYVSLRDAKKRLADTNCKIRPWLQNFNLPDRGRYGGSRYGASQIAAQIRAARDVGITEFLMWDPHNRFNELDAAMARMNKEGWTAKAPPAGMGIKPATEPKPASAPAGQPAPQPAPASAPPAAGGQGR